MPRSKDWRATGKSSVVHRWFAETTEQHETDAKRAQIVMRECEAFVSAASTCAHQTPAQERRTTQVQRSGNAKIGIDCAHPGFEAQDPCKDMSKYVATTLGERPKNVGVCELQFKQSKTCCSKNPKKSFRDMCTQSGETGRRE